MKRKHDSAGELFTSIPKEILLYIFSLTDDLESLKALKLTCWKFTEIMEESIDFCIDAIIKFGSDKRLRNVYASVKDCVDTEIEPKVSSLVWTSYLENEAIQYLWNVVITDPERKNFTLIVEEKCALFPTNCMKFEIDFIIPSSGTNNIVIKTGGLSLHRNPAKKTESITHVLITKAALPTATWVDGNLKGISVIINARLLYNKKETHWRNVYFFKDFLK
jgi:hypothetical protein